MRICNQPRWRTATRSRRKGRHGALALFGLCGLVVISAPSLAATSPPLLVDSAWLQSQESAPLVLHVDGSQKRYEEAHVEGARFLSYPEIVVDIEEPGKSKLITEFPPVAELEAVFRQAGVKNDQHVVLYGHPVLAARAFLTLEVLGHQKVSILDGGFAAWKAAGGAVSSGASKGPAGDFRASWQDGILVDAEWVQTQLPKSKTALVDARPLNEYTGDDGGMGGKFKAGHIPGARHLYWQELMRSEKDQRFLPQEGLAKRFTQAGVDSGDTMVSYCFIGMRASVNYFVSRLLGHQTVFYDGSWNDWSDRDLPVEAGPDESTGDDR